MKRSWKSEEGIATVGILVILLVVVTLGLGAFSVWSYSQYQDLKNNTAAKIDKAVTAAKQTQQSTDNANFAEASKLPLVSTTGPEDYGSVTFKFPKTWSMYVGESDGNGYMAYYNPVSVPPVSLSQQFALHESILPKAYETTLAGYNPLIKKGDLKSTLVTVNNLTGTRLDGKFSTNIEGSAVIFKVRDKTLTIQTDSPTYRDDFTNLIVPSITFTP